MTAQLASINLATNSVSTIAPTPEQPAAPTVEQLTQDLATLEVEFAKVKTLAACANDYASRLTKATSAHILGTVSTADLARIQKDFEEANDAINRRHILEQALVAARRALEYAQSREKKEFIDGIHRQFEQVYARYRIESSKLLEIFRELHKLNLQSQGMRSIPLMDPNAYRLDLPAIRREADSELFTVGQMLQTGGY